MRFIPFRCLPARAGVVPSFSLLSIVRMSAAPVASFSESTEGSPVPYVEVSTAPVSVCWKCKGSGAKIIKAPRPAVPSEADLPLEPQNGPTLISVSCSICTGTGTVGRKRARPEDRPKRPMKAFPGWVPIGPAPRGAGENPDLLERPDEDLCYLVGQWMIFQQKDTHRYSTDDVVTAWVASRAVRQLHGGGPLRCLDIGCGIGSVLMMTAWLLPRATCKGVEAQEARASQARRSILYNGIDDRVAVVTGDLRDPANTSEGAVYDLITGTPPYFDVTVGALPGSEESARCLFEYRGGIEEYAKAAARLLAPRGVFVVVESALGTSRGYKAAKDASLDVIARIDCIPKAGKPPLFVVFVMTKSGQTPAQRIHPEAFTKVHPPPVDIAGVVDISEEDVESPEVVTGEAGEPVVRVVVRDSKAIRTPFYRQLLFELGKPS